MSDTTLFEYVMETISSRPDLILPLLAAHLLADFPLQHAAWIESKRNGFSSGALWFHSAVASLLSFILLGRFEVWWIIPIFFLSHGVIDGLKARFFDGLIAFILAQLAHLAVIAVLVFLLSSRLESQTSWLPIPVWSYGVAVLFLWFFQGVFVGKATKDWRDVLNKNETVDVDLPESKESRRELKNAGLWIGRIERLLIFLFVAQGDYQVVSFLVAAKAIFRFAPKDRDRQRLESEYFLVGTLISFTLAIVTALIWRGSL